MFSRIRQTCLNTQRRGAIAVLAAVFLVMIFAFTAFTVDIGYISIVDQELQGAVDGAALAAAYELEQGEQTGPVFDAAGGLASLNSVNGQSLSVTREHDIEVGFWDELTATFTPMPGATDLSLTNAVRVKGRLNQNRGSQVNLFFAPVLGHSDVEMDTSAIAVIGRDRPRDVMLVVDRSGSMSSYNRMTYTKAAALQLVDELDELETVIAGDETQGDRVGLSIYSVKQTETIEVEQSGSSKKKQSPTSSNWPSKRSALATPTTSGSSRKVCRTTSSSTCSTREKARSGPT